MSVIRDTTAPLFAASDAGHFTMPAQLLKMRAGLTALQQTSDPHPRTADEEHADLLQATITAAVAGEPLPDTTGTVGVTTGDAVG